MFKPGFFGKNTPRFWIGQVPLGQFSNKNTKERWGDRVKVRIVGYHPKEGDLMADDDLPWAIILRPTSHGSLNRTSTAIVGGEWVMGLFLDDDYEKPFIIGVFGRSDPRYKASAAEQVNQNSTQFEPTLNYTNPINPSPANLFGSGNSTPSGQKTPVTPPSL